MEKLIDVNVLVHYLKKNDLMIGPKSAFAGSKISIDTLLRRNMVTYSEISDCGIWGNIKQKRVYQLAKQFAKPGEIIKPGATDNSPEKISIVAVKRIAKMRGVNINQ